jgi:hypothetical protein
VYTVVYIEREMRERPFNISKSRYSTNKRVGLN